MADKSATDKLTLPKVSGAKDQKSNNKVNLLCKNYFNGAPLCTDGLRMARHKLQL